MNLPLLTLDVRLEPDVVLARQRARQIAGLLGFAPLDQTRIATAVSEIARNAFQYAGGGKVEFHVRAGDKPGLLIRVRERGPGIKDLQAILNGRYDSPTGMGIGILGAKRLMDEFEIVSAETGVTVAMVKNLPRGASPFTAQDLAKVSANLAQHAPQGLLEELQLQNQELLRTLQELRDRQAELAELHTRELEETNRGVVALYSELDENAIELRRISELKSRFLSNMSHEFRSPLNTILSMSGFLLDGSSELSAEQEKEIGFIRKAAMGLAALIDDLLDLAKVEAGMAVVRPEAFDVNALFEDLRGTTTPLLTRGSVELVVERPADLTTLHTDGGKVGQILRNFLSNAAKFTERGEIRLSAAPGPGDMVIFTVADTGIGIASADRRRIFEEFNQVDGPAQRKVKGTGLGLPLSRRLAGLLGGAVSVRSEPGVGSRFFAVIPRSIGSSEAADAESGAGRPALPGSPVLVVEDDPVDLLLYEKYLERAGFRPVTVRSISEARRALRRGRPAAVILDILLDAEGGWSLMDEIKRQGGTKEIPVVVLTAIEGRDRALSLGTSEFCLKPFGRDPLPVRLVTPVQGAKPRKVLIIDTDESDRAMLKGLLTAQGGFAIVEASDGEEGLRRVRLDRPDLIFIELILPDMTGFEFRERLEADVATPGIPVVLTSSKNVDDARRRWLTFESVPPLPRSAMIAEETLLAVRAALKNTGLEPAPHVPES